MNEQPEHTDLYIVEADTHEWPPMLAAARALECEGRDAGALNEHKGQVVVSCYATRAVRPDGEVEQHQRRETVSRRGDLMLFAADIEAAVARVRPPWEDRGGRAASCP